MASQQSERYGHIHMRKEKHLFHLGYGCRIGLAGLLASLLLLMGVSCTRNGMDGDGTVVDSNVGSVTSAVTEKHTTAGTVAPGTLIPDTERITERVTERLTERLTEKATERVTDTTAVTTPATTGKARGGK